MNKLILNTANEELVILLLKNDKLFFSAEKNRQHHNEIMLSKIDEILGNNNLTIADIDEFGAVIGPGSFTGIRVGVATILSFRDALQKPAFGINNLDLLFALATTQNKNVSTVAICGSFNSYFVAKLINGIVYKFERNLSLDELKSLAENSPIGMFEQDENLNCFVVKFDAKTVLECYEKNKQNSLVPVYYQLSQAEREKLKRGQLKIKLATKKHLEAVSKLERQNILTNVISFEEICKMHKNETYKIFVAEFNDEIAGFVILQITDEINIVSIAVKKEFQNLGIGTKLIEKAENFARKNKINALSLEVNEKNITAFLLYKKLGFKLRRKRKNYYADGATCLEMFKQI